MGDDVNDETSPGADEPGEAAGANADISDAVVEPAVDEILSDDVIEGDFTIEDQIADDPILSSLMAERDQFKDIALRLQADFDNYRKRVAGQQVDEVARATGKMAESLLPVLDACEAAFIQHPAAIEPLFNLLLGELRKQGLEALNLLDQPFDPSVADAVLHEPGDGGEAVVAEVLRSGYTWKGKVLRPAMVKVRGEKDYYHTLGVVESASAKDITKTYRKLARELHPDANPGNAAAEERFKDVSAAYDVLGDEVKRKEYDEVRRLGPMGGGGPGGFSFNAGEAGLGDLIGNMFGGRRSRGGAASGVGPQRGQDIEATLNLAFEDAATGLETSLHLTAGAQCSTCAGSGAKPGTSPRVCSGCGGRGVVDDNQGFFSFSSPCRSCQGAGTSIEYPCGTCRGSGIEQRPREVKVRIPAGVADAQRIRIKGRGTPGRNGGPPGDLFVTCQVQPHRLFCRDGNNLTLRVPITFAEAALGGVIQVPTLDGSTVGLRIKPGTQSGTRHRVTGRGIATTSSTADLIVTVDVVVPTTLTDDEREAIEQFASANTSSPRAHLGAS
jgi:molecular chaperone DnaJ